MELCGGTHIHHTGEIGYFRILREEGIAAGVRRIEAVTGEEADRILREEKSILATAEQMLRCRSDEVADRIGNLLEERKDLEKQLKKARQTSTTSEMESMVQNAVQAGDIRVVVSRVEVSDIEELRKLGDRLRNALKSGVGVLGSAMKDKVHFLCVVTDDIIKDKGIKAGELVQAIAKIAGGSGGGKPHMALAGGKDVKKLRSALEQVPQIVKSMSRN
jgi:alanyl-tRNA synthetase